MNALLRQARGLLKGVPIGTVTGSKIRKTNVRSKKGQRKIKVVPKPVNP
jgi:hypothetical protein